MNQNSNRLKQQRGAVLVVSLLILLVMTIIGMTAMQTTTLEEKMAGNARDHNLAFQAAETAIRDAEQLINASVGRDWLNPSGPLLDLSATEPDALANATWTGASSQDYSQTDLTTIKTVPRFFLKYTGSYDYINSGPGINNQQAKVGIDTFRITARGTGGSDNARAVLRTNWGKASAIR